MGLIQVTSGQPSGLQIMLTETHCIPVDFSIDSFEQVPGTRLSGFLMWKMVFHLSQSDIGLQEWKIRCFRGYLFIYLNLLVSDVICGAHRKLSCWVQDAFSLNEASETVLKLMCVCLFNAYRCALCWGSVSFKLEISSEIFLLQWQISARCEFCLLMPQHQLILTMQWGILTHCSLQELLAGYRRRGCWLFVEH